MIKTIKNPLKMSGLFVCYGNAGAVMESKGMYGTSHLMEHMVCKTTDHMRSRFLENCICDNAFTGDEYVVFFMTGLTSRMKPLVKEYLRSINRLAGLLELADEQFCQIRTGINEYRRRVQSLVSTGNFEEVSLDGDSYANYLKLKPFDALNNRIASINQAEISKSPLRQYLDVFKHLGFKTLGDLDRFIKDNSDDAFQLAAFQLANTDLDIISSSLGVMSLITVYALKSGSGPLGLKDIFDILYGESDGNKQRAERLYEKASQLSFMQKK